MASYSVVTSSGQTLVNILHRVRGLSSNSRRAASPPPREFMNASAAEVPPLPRLMTNLQKQVLAMVLAVCLLVSTVSQWSAQPEIYLWVHVCVRGSQWDTWLFVCRRSRWHASNRT